MVLVMTLMQEQGQTVVMVLLEILLVQSKMMGLKVIIMIGRLENIMMLPLVLVEILLMVSLTIILLSIQEETRQGQRT